MNQVGPNRLHVTLARELACAGYASVRYDLANLCDSVKDEHPEENITYPVEATRLISEVMTAIRDQLGYDRVVLTGLCSAATLAFLAGLDQPDDAPLAEIIMVNPKAFDRDHLKQDVSENVVMRASYYRRAMRDPTRWLRLLRADVDYAKLFSYMLKRVSFLIRKSCRRALTLVGMSQRTQLARDLQHYVKTDRALSLFLSTRDSGHTTLLESSDGVAKRLIDRGRIGIRVIEDGDHTLTAKRCRDDLVRQFLAHLRERYPIADTVTPVASVATLNVNNAAAKETLHVTRN